MGESTPVASDGMTLWQRVNWIQSHGVIIEFTPDSRTFEYSSSHQPDRESS